MMSEKVIHVGIGFATGRKNFKRVLSTYIHNWKECGLIDAKTIKLHVFIAYDVKYNDTRPADYTNLEKTLTNQVDSIHFLDRAYTIGEKRRLMEQHLLTERESGLLFDAGYAALRNIVLYAAIRNGMDYLLFLDDDEYPMAVTKTRETAIWSGQHVLATHLRYIDGVDVTNGRHCGYISPIPNIKFNETLTEDVFRRFIEAISNEIVNWDSVLAAMNRGGVTYAEPDVLVRQEVEEVAEVSHARFISGANLCLNLSRPCRIFPFYNPPGARGEDTFLSTCLSERTVLRVPCYTFHDGFSTYRHLLSGVLPTKLKPIEVNTRAVVNRFYQACVGWVRYKPLLLYITQRDRYEDKIEKMKQNLTDTLPKLGAYFQSKEFVNLLQELETYHSQVETHYQIFVDLQDVWHRICGHLSETRRQHPFVTDDAIPVPYEKASMI